MGKQSSMITLVKEWQQSGMTIGDFAKKTGVPKSTLGYWICKLKDENKVSKGQLPQFIELDPLPENPVNANSDSKKPQIELTFPGGLCLKIYG